MSLDEIRQPFNARPFRPIRLILTDGASYDVRHPELCVPGTRVVFIGQPAPGQSDPVFDRYAIFDLIHITRLEPLDLPAKGNGQG